MKLMYQQFMIQQTLCIIRKYYTFYIFKFEYIVRLISTFEFD